MIPVACGACRTQKTKSVVSETCVALSHLQTGGKIFKVSGTDGLELRIYPTQKMVTLVDIAQCVTM